MLNKITYCDVIARFPPALTLLPPPPPPKLPCRRGWVWYSPGCPTLLTSPQLPAGTLLPGWCIARCACT